MKFVITIHPGPPKGGDELPPPYASIKRRQNENKDFRIWDKTIGGKMTREEFDKLPSGWGTEVCPDCGTRITHPNPGCACRGWSGEERKPHIMKNHHTCPVKEEK